MYEAWTTFSSNSSLTKWQSTIYYILPQKCWIRWSMESCLIIEEQIHSLFAKSNFLSSFSFMWDILLYSCSVLVLAMVPAPPQTTTRRSTKKYYYLTTYNILVIFWYHGELSTAVRIQLMSNAVNLFFVSHFML